MPKQTILAAERVELPTVFLNGKPYVELKINGKGPYRFAVDTGAEIFALTPRVASEADVGITPRKAKLHGVNGSSGTLSVVTIDRLEAPGFILRGMLGSVLDSETTGWVGLDGNQMGGIIGMATLKQVLLEIDYPNRKVSVAKLDSATPAIESGHPYTGTERFGVLPHVKVTTPSAKHPQVLVLIDTGSSVGFDFSDITAFPVVGGLSKTDSFYGGIGGVRRELFGLLNGDIRLGQFTWSNPVVFGSDGNRIGSGAMTLFKLVIDPKRKMLWLVGEGKEEGAEGIITYTWNGPRDPDGRPSVYGYASWREGFYLIVKEVDPGSRAERAGLKVGDRYTWDSADSGRPVEQTGSDPTRMRMHIVRGEEKLEIVLSLMEQITVKTTTGAKATATPATVTRD